MGCGASVARSSPSTGALNPGDLRDRSLQPTVVLHEGVAQAGARTHLQERAPPPAQPQLSPAPQPQPEPDEACAAPTPASAAPAASAAAAVVAAAAATSSATVAHETTSPIDDPWVVVEKPEVDGAEPATAIEELPPPPAPPEAEARAPPAACEQPGPQPRMVDCAVSLQFLIDFCATVPEDMPTWKVVTDVVVPATRDRRCRYVEHIDPRHVGHCDYFISHRWATPFSHLVRYVRKHLVELGNVVEAAGAGKAPTQDTSRSSGSGKEGEEQDEPKRSADQVFVWCDIFAINQHPSQVQADDLSQLKNCVEDSAQTLLCLDDKGMVLTRIWCLYEIWNTVLAGGPPKLVVLGYDVDEKAFKDVYIVMDVAEAEATVESDRARILADIAASTGLQELNMVIKKSLVESTQHEAEYAEKVLVPRAKNFTDVQVICKTINKHIQMLVAVGRSSETSRYSNFMGSISESMNQRFQAEQDQLARKGRTTGSGIAGSGGGGAAGGGSGGGEAKAAAAAGQGIGVEGDAASTVASWHWSSYPRDSTARKVLERADAAGKGGRYDEAVAGYREAAAEVERALGAAPSGAAAAAAAALDLAGCRMALGVFLFKQGFRDQAAAEAEPAVPAFEQHAGADSLTFASVAQQLAVLMNNDWGRKDQIKELLEKAYAVQQAQLGAHHATTLETLEARAKAAMMTGDMPGSMTLHHQYAVGLSGGADLAAAPSDDPRVAAAATAAAAAVADPELSVRATDAWRTLASYMSQPSMGAGREDECIRICRALIPHRRRQQIRMCEKLLEEGTGEYLQMAKDLIQKVQALAAPPGASGRASGAAGGGGGGGDGAEPAALMDPEDPRLDVGMHSPELTAWSTALAIKGRLEEAIRLQWRIADTLRASGSTNVPYGATKLTLVEAYEQGVSLDMVVPGANRVALAMLAERDGSGGGSGGGGGAGGTAAAGGGSAASPPAPADSSLPAADADSSGPAAAAAKYDGPSERELTQQLIDWGAECSKAGVMNFERRVEISRQIVECKVANYGAGSVEVADARADLANALSSTGRKDEAVAAMRAALAAHEKFLAGKDPQMVHKMSTLADMLDDRVEGEQLYRRALALMEKVHGPDHSEAGRVMMSLAGYVMQDRERLEEGKELLERGQATFQAFLAKQAERAKAF